MTRVDGDARGDPVVLEAGPRRGTVLVSCRVLGFCVLKFDALLHAPFDSPAYVPWGRVFWVVLWSGVICGVHPVAGFVYLVQRDGVEQAPRGWSTYS